MKKEKFIKAYLQAPPLPINDIDKARALETRRSRMASRVVYAGTIDDVEIDTGTEHSRVRIYTPSGPGPFLPVLYMHGGGFSIGSPDTSDNLCRALSSESGALVISVDYKLAPEHKFPFALEECYRVATWICDNDVALNSLSDRLVIAGDSAGGTLAAALCLLNRERQELPITQQVLICPMLDQKTPLEEKISRLNDPLLTPENSQTFSRYYFRDPLDAEQPLASPLLAETLFGLPPALIVTAELDPLAEEARYYHERLHQAGVDATLLHYPGQVHDFPLFIKALDDAKDVAQIIGHALRQSTHQDPTPF